MEQSKLTTDSPRVKKPAGTRWRRMKYFIAKAKGSRFLKSKPSETDDDGSIDMTKSPALPDEGNSFQMFKFEESRRRATICFVLEEKKQYLGIPLSELRKDLIVYNMLDKLELL